MKKHLKIMNLPSQINECTRCPLCSNVDHKVLPTIFPPYYVKGVHKLPRIVAPSLILYVTNFPSMEGYITKEPITGELLAELKDINDEVGNPSYTITPSVHCAPFTDEYRSSTSDPSPSEIKACRVNLDSIVEATDPQLIVALGKVAARAIKHITNRKTIMINHPYTIISSKHYELEHKRAVLKLKSALQALS